MSFEMQSMNQWWQRRQGDGGNLGGFAVIGVGRFGSSVCSELLRSGADVLAIDSSQRAIDDLRQMEPAIEARVVDCTDEEALRAAGVLELSTVVVPISEPIEASMTATLICKDAKDTRVRQVIARATSDLHHLNVALAAEWICLTYSTITPLQIHASVLA